LSFNKEPSLLRNGDEPFFSVRATVPVVAVPVVVGEPGRCLAPTRSPAAAAARRDRGAGDEAAPVEEAEGANVWLDGLVDTTRGAARAVGGPRQRAVAMTIAVAERRVHMKTSAVGMRRRARPPTRPL